MPSAAVLRANLLSLSDLAPDFPSPSPSNSSHTISLSRPAHLSSELKDSIWRMYEENMVPLTRGTSLFSPKEEKWEELFEGSTVFVLITQDGGATEADSAVKDASEGGELIAFASIRFDDEEDLHGNFFDVVYIYEMQTHRAYRGQKLGSILLDRAESIGRMAGMKAGMLTCLKNNLPALAFYNKHSYAPDEIDPTRIELHEHRAKVERMLAASRRGGRARGKSRATPGHRGTQPGGTSAITNDSDGEANQDGPEKDAINERWYLSVEEESTNGKGPDYRILSKRL